MSCLEEGLVSWGSANQEENTKSFGGRRLPVALNQQDNKPWSFYIKNKTKSSFSTCLHFQELIAVWGVVVGEADKLPIIPL